MQITNNHPRLLALDVRPQRLGYAVFAGPHTLLDWGVRSFRGGINAVRVPFRRKVARLIAEWQPGVVILNEPRSRQASTKTKIVQIQARSSHIPVLLMNRQTEKEVFRDQRNKHERARVLAARFAELSSRLPPKRKPWQSEDYRMSIFDATAVGVTYFQPSREATKQAELAM